MMLQFSHSMLRALIQSLQPLLVPFCFGLAWLLVALIFWSIWTALRDVISHAKQMHEIPCASCQFFTNTHYLKCPIHPKTALSIDAINCPDYQSAIYVPALEAEDEIGR